MFYARSSAALRAFQRSRVAPMLMLTGLGLHPALAQKSTGIEGGAFLLLPIGARAVALGEAVTARRDPTDAIWWNPAGLGAASRREVVVQHSQSYLGVGDALSLVVPSSLLGVLALGADVLDYGPQEARLDGGPPTGTILTRSFVVGASYAASLGHASGGVTFKVAQFRVDCSGTCPETAVFAATASAVDVGMQYHLGGSRPLTLGIAMRNLGPSIQVNDAAQRDPTARRLHVGAEYRYTPPKSLADSVELRISADLIHGLDHGAPVPRFGAELAWQKRAYVRGGYVMRAPLSEYGGPSIGLGYVTRALSIDLSRVVSGFSADAGQAPTYLSLRLQY